MSYTFLREQGEESSVESFSDIPAYVLSRLNLTAEKSYSNDSGMESCQSSRSGMMSEPLTESRGKDVSMSFAGDSRAKTSVLPEKVAELEANDQAFGEKWPESFAKLDRATCLWKTRQLWLFEDSEQSLETWPRWGLMHDGECWALAVSEGCTGEREYGFVPTPTACDHEGSGRPRKNRGPGLNLRDWFMQKYKLQYPPVRAVEFLMEWPIGHTDLKPLATDKFQQWLNSHGKCSQHEPE